MCGISLSVGVFAELILLYLYVSADFHFIGMEMDTQVSMSGMLWSFQFLFSYSGITPD